MLTYIKQHGVVLRRDLREELNVPASVIDKNLADPIAKGLVFKERLEDESTSRICTHYRWVGPGARPRKLGPCLGGCGRQIVRDGRTFRCSACRAAAASVSPYAP